MVSIAASNGSASAKKFRDRIGKKLTNSQLRESKSLLGEWVAAHP